MLTLKDIDPSYWLGDVAHSTDFYLSSVDTIFPYNYEVPFDYFLKDDAFIRVFVQAILAATGASEEF